MLHRFGNSWRPISKNCILACVCCPAGLSHPSPGLLSHVTSTASSPPQGDEVLGRSECTDICLQELWPTVYLLPGGTDSSGSRPSAPWDIQSLLLLQVGEMIDRVRKHSEHQVERPGPSALPQPAQNSEFCLVLPTSDAFGDHPEAWMITVPGDTNWAEGYGASRKLPDP
jgi:hypothetical protein